MGYSPYDEDNTLQAQITTNTTNLASVTNTVNTDLSPNVVQNNYTATADPTASDDTNLGYVQGSEWVNTNTNGVFKCLDAASGAAVWSDLSQSGNQVTRTTVVDAAGNGDYTSLSAAITAGATTIYIRSGSYTESAQIDIAGDSVSVTGESKESVSISWTSGTNGINLSGDNFTIKGVSLSGHTGMAGSLIRSTGVYLTVNECTIKDVDNATGCGIHATGFYTKVNNCFFTNISNAHIQGSTPQSEITSNRFEQGASLEGVAILNPGGRTKIADNSFYNFKNGTRETAIYITANLMWGMIIANNLIDTCDNGLRITSSGSVQFTAITGNMFNACGPTGSNIYAEASSTFDYNVMSGNTHDDNNYSIRLLSGSYNTITSSMFRGRDHFDPSVTGRGVVIAGDFNTINDNSINSYNNAIELTASANDNNVITNVINDSTATDIIDSGSNNNIVTSIAGGASDTDGLPEGATNLYYTEARVSANTSVAANTAHSADTNNPHSVTATQVGLGNVDNTSDANKPVSTAQQTALDGKADTAHTHTLSDITDSGTAAAINISVGTTAPGSPAVGDLWVDTN